MLQAWNQMFTAFEESKHFNLFFPNDQSCIIFNLFGFHIRQILPDFLPEQINDIKMFQIRKKKTVRDNIW